MASAREPDRETRIIASGMRLRSQVLWLLVVTLGSAASVVAQGPSLLGPPGATTTSGEHSRLGRFHLGPLYVTPLLRLGTVGLDTNVFYTPTDRRADFSSSGGPGLRIVMPIKGS